MSAVVLRFFLMMLCLGSITTTSFAQPARKLLAAEATPVNSRYLLVGPDGQAVSDGDFRGRFQLITFGYTYCPDICPTTLVDIAEILKQLGEDADRLQAIFISVDPERDTPQVLKTYTAFFDKRILALTGSPELIQRAAHNYRVRYAKVIIPGRDPKNYVVDHSAGMYLLGPDGDFIKKFAYGRPVDEILQEVRGFLRTP